MEESMRKKKTGGAPPNLQNETSDLPLNLQRESELLHLML